MVATQTFYMFTPKIGEDEPILTSIFFRWVETTNQKMMGLGKGNSLENMEFFGINSLDFWSVSRFGKGRTFRDESGM